MTSEKPLQAVDGRGRLMHAPLRLIVGQHRQIYRGGFRLILECKHRVNGTPREARGKRVRCAKCRDGKLTDR